MFQRMSELSQKGPKARLCIAGGLALAAAAGALYLYFHNPMKYPMPCMFYVMTGLYCPGCGSGRACFSVLHGDIWRAFCYNPMFCLLLPFLGLYFAARLIDWVVTGGNHVDGKINQRMLWIVVAVVIIFGAVRNIPVFPFRLLAPGGMLSL